MQEYLGLLIATARRRIKQAVLARAGHHELSAQQFWFLIALSEHPGMSQVDLAQRVRADAPTASRSLAGLRRRRLVRIEVDPEDRRRGRAFLTPAGERLAKELSHVAQQIRATVVEGMTEAEVDALRSGLRRVIENLDRLEARAARERPRPRGQGVA
ncbi:MAG TPA: MarR family transcriptional regulator [Anaeromyxobacteraceae bacterium]